RCRGFYEGPAPAGNRWSIAAAVGSGENLEQMAVRVFPVQTAAAIAAVDLAGAALSGVGPVLCSARANAAEDLVEFGLAHQEGIMLAANLAVRAHEVERYTVVHIHCVERSVVRRHRAAKDIRKVRCRRFGIARQDNRVVQLHRHREYLLMPQISTGGTPLLAASCGAIMMPHARTTVTLDNGVDPLCRRNRR